MKTHSIYVFDIPPYVVYNEDQEERKWQKQISCCNDGFRPMIFKLEVTAEESVKDF